MQAPLSALVMHHLRNPATVLVAGCLISLIGFGARSSFGLYFEPMTVARGWDFETFALALAIQNLLWGLCLPLAAGIADRYGTPYIIGGGALIYALGIWGMANSEQALMLHLTAGLLTGVGVAFTAFSLALSAMSRVVGRSHRSLALGLGTACGSLGQVVFSPLSQALIERLGWHSALLYVALLTLLMLPLAFLLPRSTAVKGEATSNQSITVFCFVVQLSLEIGPQKNWSGGPKFHGKLARGTKIPWKNGPSLKILVPPRDQYSMENWPGGPKFHENFGPPGPIFQGDQNFRDSWPAFNSYGLY